jgi:VIT1/CCC1 family predicted Fe2+/Mn2+ transporter
MSVNMGTSPNAAAGRDDRSVGELLGELMRETVTLVQQEINLAKTEMSQKATKVGVNVGAIAVGGAVLYAGVLSLIAALVLMLAHFRVMDAWAAALVVGVIVTVAGGFLVKKGLDALKDIDPAPRQTIETLKEDKEWVQQQLK